MTDYIILIGAAFVFLIVMYRLLVGRCDHGRMQRYFYDRGGELIEARWLPFGPGWLGSRGERAYEVQYLDQDGNRRHAYCRTSMLSGVFLTDDSMEQRADAVDTEDSLREENRRLREELEQLKRRQVT